MFSRILSKFSSIQIVFSVPIYLALSAIITLGFWVIFNVLDQLIFFYPIWIFYLPDDATIGFIVTTITAILLGMIISMNVFILRHYKLRLNKSIFSGTILSLVSSTCASCSSIGFLIISTFGGIGVFAVNFLSVYQMPLRLISIAILLFAFYTVHKRIVKNCVITYPKREQEEEN